MAKVVEGESAGGRGKDKAGLPDQNFGAPPHAVEGIDLNDIHLGGFSLIQPPSKFGYATISQSMATTTVKTTTVVKLMLTRTLSPQPTTKTYNGVELISKQRICTAEALEAKINR